MPETFRAVSAPRRAAGAPYIVGAMMTPSHAHLGERLAASCRTHSLPLALFEVPSVHRSISPKGSDDVRYTKANFVQFLLQHYQRPILYLDVDCKIAERPTRIDEMATEPVDFAIFNWLAEEHTEAYTTTDVTVRDGGTERVARDRFYRFSHSIDFKSDTQLLCSGAVQWYNTTDAARRLLVAWQEIIERSPRSADDKCLDFAFNNLPVGVAKLQSAWLEKRYTRYAWWIYERPVIDHPEFPSSGQGFLPLDELDGRRRIYPELLQGRDVAPLFPKDCLIDTERRTLLRFKDGSWREVGAVSLPLWLPNGLKMTPTPGTDAMIDRQFQEALALHQRGQVEEARFAYEQVLERQPRHVQALTFLAVIALQLNEFERALELANKALQIDPRSAAAHLTQGHTLLRLERREAAVASYDCAIALKPDFADAYSQRGNVLSQLGRHAEAVASYDKALEYQPDAAEIHNNRGNALRDLRQYPAAVASYDRAIAAMPRLPEPYLNRGLALHEIKQYDAALASYDQAIALNPGYAEAYYSRGNVLKDLKQLDSALTSYDQAIATRSDYAPAHSNRGNVLSELERFDAALASYDAAISIAPDDPDTHCNRGNLLSELGRHGEALSSFDRAVAVDPHHAQSRFSRSFAYLVTGDLERGWRDFEWRWQNEHCITSRERRSFPQPQWFGEEPLTGKTLLVHCEQGFGDTIQFCRYAELLANLGATVVFEVPQPLRTLFASLEGVAQWVAQGEALPPFDFYSPLMSLPLALRTTLDTIPAKVPYLHSSPDRSRYWRRKLGEPRAARVGLVWAGGFRANQPEPWPVNNRRNIPLATLAPLAHPHIEFYSLQKGQPAEQELAELNARGWNGPRLVDYTRDLRDFDDTAALIEQLDLVISVDTSTAHLAGALGKPVWILNRFDTCWRWLLDRTDSPWYPSLRLYRQARRGDWEGVVRRVRDDLDRFAMQIGPRRLPAPQSERELS